jgi:hypothetical protein
MAYVFVRYSKERDVYIDSQIAGKTQYTLMVEEGHHIFDLGEPADYLPESQEVLVQHTTSLRPQIVEFTPKETPA